MIDFLESLKSIMRDTYNHLNDYIDDFKNNIKDIIHYLRIINYFKEDYEIIYEIIFKARCDAISNDIKEIANLPCYLIIYFFIFILVFVIIYIVYLYNFLTSYLHGKFIVGNNNIHTYVWIFIITISLIMTFYLYYIYKRFSIKKVGRVILEFFIFLTVYLALQILILYGIIGWATGFSWISKILYYIYDVVFVFVIIYMAIILALFFRCPHLLKELRKHLNKIYSQCRQYAENLNRIFGQSIQIYNQNSRNRRKRYKKYNF
ncbi:MAG: hypothetical protein RXQ68_00115 [Candidatus Nanopusillus sp.]